METADHCVAFTRCLNRLNDRLGEQCVPQAQKSFWTHPMVLLAVKAQVEAHFSPFRGSANLGALDGTTR